MAVNDDERRGALGAARALLGKVVDKVVDAAFGAESVTPPPAQEANKEANKETDPPADREPIPTRTMAGLLVAQGHRDRALAIYDHLVEAHPDDRGLRSEADALRETVPAGGQGADEDQDAPVVAVAAGKNRLFLSWQVPAEALDRARRILGGQGEVRLRVMVTATNPDEVVATETVERRSIQSVGDWVITAPAGALCTAAVGVAEGERFVCAAHAPTVAV